MRILALACFLPALVLAQTTTGPAVPEMAVVDQTVIALMNKYHVPGASIAVTRNGKLLMARGYGNADRDTNQPVQPDSLFRLASVSKVFTSVAILKLWDDKKIDLDSKAFSTYLSDLKPLPGATVDPRLADITVRMLLTHTGGWDRDISFDPMFRSAIVVDATGTQAPASTEAIIRYMLGQKLDFTPGARFAYSNFGYAVLGRIIERITGMTYEAYVRQYILTPAGIGRMRIGATLLEGATPGEVRYYNQSAATATTVFPIGPHTVPWQYGGWYLESMDAHGGWIASAIDVVRLYNAMDGRRGQRLLSPAAIAQLTLRPNIPEYAGTAAYYGMGIMVRPVGSDANWWHSGLLDGSATHVVRLANNGYVWCVLYNIRVTDSSGLDNETDVNVNTALGKVTSVPNVDQFTTYPDASTDQVGITAQDGVLNGASFQRGIVPGSWVTLRGDRMSTTSRSWTGSDIVNGVLPSSLDGVSVKINGKAASVYYISPGQLNVQAPEDTATGWVKVEVTRGGTTSSTVLAELRTSSPAFFQYPADARTFVVGVHLDTVVVGDADKVPGTRFASPEERLLLFGTGFVPSMAGKVLASVVAVTVPVTVRFGNTIATVEGTALIAPGLFQCNIVVPRLTPGDYEVTIEINGRRSPAGVLIPVRN